MTHFLFFFIHFKMTAFNLSSFERCLYLGNWKKLKLLKLPSFKKSAFPYSIERVSLILLLRITVKRKFSRQMSDSKTVLKVSLEHTCTHISNQLDCHYHTSHWLRKPSCIKNATCINF